MSRARGALLLAAVLAASAGLLHVPRERVPLFYDALGYAAQGWGMFHGAGSAMLIDGEALPGFYPAGMSFLGAAAHAVLGPDLRVGIHAVFACALLAVAATFALGRRLLDPWTGAVAGLLVLASPLFRETSRNLLSQAPSILAFAGCAWAHLRVRGAGGAFALGLVAMLSGTLRFANLALPAGLATAELLAGRARGDARRPCLLGLAAGCVVGAGLLVAHNVWAFGGPFTTGYDRWGQSMQASFSLRYVLAPPVYPTAPEGTDLGWPLLGNLVGLGRLYVLPVFLAALVGAWVLLRARRERPDAALFLGAAVAVPAWQYAVLALYVFRSDGHLVPTLAFVAPLAAVGACAWGGTRWRAAVAAAALLLALLGARGEQPRSARELQAIDRYDALVAADAALPPDAALVTAGDPPLVDPLFRRDDRRILYLGPFARHAIGEIAARELGGRALGEDPDADAARVVAWVQARLAEGRAVYVDRLGPTRTVEDLHRAVRRALARAFEQAPCAVASLRRLAPKG